MMMAQGTTAWEHVIERLSRMPYCTEKKCSCRPHLPQLERDLQKLTVTFVLVGLTVGDMHRLGSSDFPARYIQNVQSI